MSFFFPFCTKNASDKFLPVLTLTHSFRTTVTHFIAVVAFLPHHIYYRCTIQYTSINCSCYCLALNIQNSVTIVNEARVDIPFFTQNHLLNNLTYLYDLETCIKEERNKLSLKNAQCQNTMR